MILLLYPTLSAAQEYGVVAALTPLAFLPPTVLPYFWVQLTCLSGSFHQIIRTAVCQCERHRPKNLDSTARASHVHPHPPSYFVCRYKLNTTRSQGAPLRHRGARTCVEPAVYYHAVDPHRCLLCCSLRSSGACRGCRSKREVWLDTC